MERPQIIKRIEFLRNAIAYSRVENKEMTLAQGICCNQEVAACYKALQRLSITGFTEATISYQIPAHLEVKVIRINEIIRTTNWQKPEIF